MRREEKRGGRKQALLLDLPNYLSSVLRQSLSSLRKNRECEWGLCEGFWEVCNFDRRYWKQLRRKQWGRGKREGERASYPQFVKYPTLRKREEGGQCEYCERRGRRGGEPTLLCHLVWVGYSLSSWRVLIDRYDPFQDERESGVTIQWWRILLGRRGSGDSWI